MKIKQLIFILVIVNLGLIAQQKTYIVGTKITEPFVIQKNGVEYLLTFGS